MEYTLVALLVVSIVAGSTLHASVVPYPQLLPYKVTYSDIHSPVLLSHHLGLSNEDVLAAAALQVAPAPVSEAVEEDINGSITESQLQQIQGIPTLPESAILNEGDLTSGGSIPDLTALAPENKAALPGPTSECGLPSPAPAPTDPALESAPEQELSKSSSIVPLPVVVASANASKALGGANVNVNVHVNVNGDGKGSIFNATSVSKIKAPIEDGHKLHKLH